MSQPKLSIITVCYNAVSTIEATIKSVLGQTFKDFEYLIIDANSTDGTIEVIEKYSGYNNIRYVSEKDDGVFDAMNKGIGLASGEWLYFLGSDDIFYSEDVVEKIFTSGTDNAEEVIYGNVQFLHSGVIYDGPFDHEKISTKNICHQALFVKKALFGKIGLFDCRYKMSADYYFNLKWMGQRLPSRYVDLTVAIYNEQGMSGKIWDEVFFYDFDRLLIENNIVSQRSFSVLKSMHEKLITSYSYKVGRYLITPLARIKSKLISGRS